MRAKGVGYARHQSPLKEVIEVRTLPPKMVQALAPFAPLFSERVFRHARVLLIGAILAPGARTVSSALRAMGLDQERSASIATTEFSAALELVEPPSEPRPVGSAPRGVRRRGRPTDSRHRRDAGATLREEDRCQGRLP